MRKPLTDVKDLKLTRISIGAKLVVVLLLVSMLTGALNIKPTRAQPATSRLDNLVITSSDLEVAASSLAQWKNSSGIPSRVLNVEWINSTYSGVDEPEKIRNCIKDFYDNSQIKYVTIFGDADKVPTRLVYTPDKNDDTNFTATDLYYAGLNGTWDDNHDELYADQRYDHVDGIPEICIGRIPVSFPQNAQPIVNKIMNYQLQFDPSQNWTRRVVLAAGTGNNGIENNLGNATTVLNEYIANIAQGKDIVKLYEEAGNLSTDSMKQQINQGAMFVNFAGHGDPGSTPLFSAGWLFYWVLAPIWWNGFGISDVQSTTNGARLPVVTTSSCSTARFDDTDCIGEWFVGNPTGGAIAYFGSTRVAYIGINNSAPYYDMGEMDRLIYEKFYKGYTKLGQMWSEAVKDYVQSNVQDYRTANSLDVKTLMEFVLLGDPTLRIYNGPETLKVPDDYPTIQGAINSAYDGDTVFVRSGTYYENVVVNKTLNLIGENRNSTIVDGNSTGNVVTLVSNNVNVSGFTFQNSAVALSSCIRLDHVSGCRIFSNIADNSKSGHADGIFLQSSEQNNISDNLVINTWDGITFWGSSNNTISGNTVVNTLYVGGTSIQFCYGSPFNQAIGNAFLGTAQIGIRCYQADSGSNVLIGNIVENYWNGIYADGSSNNIFYHNSIVNSTVNQAYLSSNVNVWDNGYPSGGNYWSDYNGSDSFFGAYQNLTGSDGIGDTPYVIDANNLDNYPLMNPWTSPDIIVMNLTSAKTAIGQGYIGTISATFENLGNKIETFNVTVYANSTCIHSEQIMLTMTNCTLCFDWNTTGFAYGNYTISAYAEPVPDETNTAKNNFTGGWVIISLVGDITGPNGVPDGKVDIKDISYVAKRFGTYPSKPLWDPNADLTGPTPGFPDGKIDIRDISAVAKHFGEYVP